MARKILLADDSVTAQNMGRRILTDAGYDVTTVNNGSAALKKIAESKPDLIILDVYMPGYGGLELCQRLREAPETARIPVLLTVGKLEPFKAEEARRVRADGFIVKPFEASELLTALAKLEDKIVPQGQPQKPSRFARAMAAADESAQAKEFGDSETGWKNRLSIPPPHSKPRDAQSDDSPAPDTSNRDVNQEHRPGPAEMKSGLEEALLSSLPHDITAEEIAAIKAAAAAFSLPINEIHKSEPASDLTSNESIGKVKERHPESVASLEKETVAITFASAPEPQAETLPDKITAKVEAADTAENATFQETKPPAPVSSDSPANIEPPSTGNGNLGDEEVTAALASLAPSNGHGHGEAAAIASESAGQDLAARDLVSVSMAAGASAQEHNGPRWIAEPAELSQNESSLALEHEMERVFAAFAAADAARLSFTNATVESSNSLSPGETAAAILETASLPMATFSSPSNSESTHESATQAPNIVAPDAQEAGQHVEIASSTIDAVSDAVTSEIKESVALAAAAGSGTAESTTVAEGLQPFAQSSESTPHPEPVEHHGESELAAAWANWKQIRETVLGAQITPQSSGNAIAEAKEIHRDAAPNETESQATQTPSTPEETAEISNIVDSVLADLKPKLMQEIARKMGKDSKKK